MNVQEKDIMNVIGQKSVTNQRELAQASNYSLGLVNRIVKNLQEENWITEKLELTKKGTTLMKAHRPKRAVILAAGFGMRMVPINTEIPKGLIEVKGEVLIERIIRQLQEVGITEITIVVGFMKERYEYLMDEFGVDLVVNREYATKNNLWSLSLVQEQLDDCYILPCDVWAEENPFSTSELYSWYMVTEQEDDESTVRVNRKRELVEVDEQTPGNQMIGISYVRGEEAAELRKKLLEAIQQPYLAHQFWESMLIEKNKWFVTAKVVRPSSVIEINTYEQLRDLDSHSMHLQTDAIQVIQDALGVSPDEIMNISVLKKGMTNRSFLFEAKGKKYIMRIPGEGTDQLINRKQEADVYRALDGLQICDDVCYMNPDNGYKITVYLEDARVCDATNEEDLHICMQKLREFHGKKLSVSHRFDLFGQIEFYESLWNGTPSYFKDYEETKKRVLSLKSWIEELDIEETLVHIDAVPDNFLFTQDGVRLIDWEYAGMQDPHVDIAMFCIYSMYQQQEIDRLIDIYFEGKCSQENRIKIYTYIAIAGLLWSNWCEYKRNLGVDFGEYSLKQYRYAKEYSKKVLPLIEQLKEGN